MDRIDLQVWVQPTSPEALVQSEPGEASTDVRARVNEARAVQLTRQSWTGVHCNAELTGDMIRKAGRPTDGALATLQRLLQQHGLSGRAWARILKVGRTIADLEGVECVDKSHVIEAATYRLDVCST